MVKVRKVVKNKVSAKSKETKTSSKANREKAAKTLKLSVPKAPYRKSQLLATLAEQAGLTKKEVAKVLDTVQAIATLHLVKNGPGQFTLPGLLKMTTKAKPATKARQGVNPFTGEAMMIKAKPASRVVRVRVLKAFKDHVV